MFADRLGIRVGSQLGARFFTGNVPAMQPMRSGLLPRMKLKLFKPAEPTRMTFFFRNSLVAHSKPRNPFLQASAFLFPFRGSPRHAHTARQATDIVRSVSASASGSASAFGSVIGTVFTSAFRRFSRSPFRSATHKSFRFSNSGSHDGLPPNIRAALIFAAVMFPTIFITVPMLFNLPPLSYFKRHRVEFLYALIGINVAVFACFSAGRGLGTLTKYFIMNPGDRNFSRMSMLLSSFSHHEFLHLLMNMLTIWYVGKAVLYSVGVGTTASLYLNSALMGSLASVLYPWVSALPRGKFAARLALAQSAGSLGASSAAFGMFSFFTMLYPHQPVSLFFVPIPGGALSALGIATAVNVAGLALRWGRIDYAGHIGGTIAGLLYYQILKYYSEKSRKRRTVW